jgi:hypothetical protein
VSDHEQIRAHFASEPQNIILDEEANEVEIGGTGLHRVCGQDCVDVFRRTPDFSCFHDGCEYECCGCGRCCAPDKCSETGKGHVWHQ